MQHWAMAQQAYGASPQTPSYGVQPSTAAMGAPDFPASWRSIVDPSNPLLWLGGIMALTLGFAGAAGSARLGKATFRASVGKD